MTASSSSASPRSLDVIGHELTHGVTEHTAGLLYQGQSGALNESISDVFGVARQAVRQLGQTAEQADWLIGAGLLTRRCTAGRCATCAIPGPPTTTRASARTRSRRDMADYVDTQDDNGGVHINSGIPNRAFVLAALAIGGNAWDDAGSIWYSVLSGDGIKADCDFATFAELTVAAATAAHGDGSSQQQAVRSGWEQVGVLSAGSGQSTTGGSAGGSTSGSAGGSAGSSAPSDGPGTEAHVLLRRTGGFAGLVRERHVAIGDLPEADARDWQHLLAAPTLQRIAQTRAPSHPDAFVYSIVCTEAGCDVTVQEPHLPEAIHSLFERTLESD